MADNMSEVLKNLVSGMDKSKLQAALPAFKKILSSPEGNELTKKIKNADQETLLRLLTTMKSPDKSDPGDAINQAANNPDYIKNLIRLLDGEGK